MKNVSLMILSFFLFAAGIYAQAPKKISDKKEARQKKVKELIKQSEEGVLIYHKHSIFGVQARTNGYGIFYEMGQMKTNRRTNTYRIDFTEIKHQKEEKSTTNALFLGNPFIYGKRNYFYQVALGFGQQFILGQKGNKNGVAVSAIYNGGLLLGLLRPYYIEVNDPAFTNGKTLKYSVADSAQFLGTDILGGTGIGKGWKELSMKPGAFVKAALRFDYGRFNESVKALEVGISVEFFGSKIPIMVAQKEKNLYFQGYIALMFGRRK